MPNININRCIRPQAPGSAILQLTRNTNDTPHIQTHTSSKNTAACLECEEIMRGRISYSKACAVPILYSKSLIPTSTTYHNVNLSADAMLAQLYSRNIVRRYDRCIHVYVFVLRLRHRIPRVPEFNLKISSRSFSPNACSNCCYCCCCCAWFSSVFFFSYS